MASPVEQIKNRLNIVDVVSSYLKLEPAGSNLKARCPFHNERTPSFFVSPGRQSYHCFGCQRGGDLISFVEEIEGLDFVGAVKTLAERAGIKLDHFSRQADQKRVRLHEVLQAAQQFYVAELARQPAVLDYLAGRGLQPETIRSFAVGFAPNRRPALIDHLRRLGFDLTELLEAGLVVPLKTGGHLDRFRQRIMFPLGDLSGRTIGFSGRFFVPAGQTAPENVAKYINSPQTPVYDKSTLLYGYDRAKLEIRRRDLCVLVEGQFDLLLSHQAGLINTVAVSGTALTERHFREAVKRLSTKMVVAFDGDAAGQEATRRAIGILLQQGFEVRLADLPAGSDPADLIARDPAAWPTLIEQSLHVIDFLLRLIARREVERRGQAQAVRREVYPYLKMLPNRLEQAHFINRLADFLSLKEEVLRADLVDWERTVPATGPAAPPAPPVAGPETSRRDKIERRLLGFYWWRPALLGERLAALWGEAKLAAAIAAWLPQQDHLILEVELLYQGRDEAQVATETDDLLAAWRRETLREALQQVMSKLTAAERGRDQSLITRYLKECQQLSEQINAL